MLLVTEILPPLRFLNSGSTAFTEANTPFKLMSRQKSLRENQ
jgi:hypothetical protein